MATRLTLRSFKREKRKVSNIPSLSTTLLSSIHKGPVKRGEGTTSEFLYKEPICNVLHVMTLCLRFDLMHERNCVCILCDIIIHVACVYPTTTRCIAYPLFYLHYARMIQHISLSIFNCDHFLNVSASICVSTFVYLSFTCLSVCLSVGLSACLSVLLSVCLPVCLLVCLYYFFMHIDHTRGGWSWAFTRQAHHLLHVWS